MRMRRILLVLSMCLGLSQAACSRLYDSRDLVGPDGGSQLDAGATVPDLGNASRCAGSGLLDCIGFEEAQLPGAPWGVLSDGATTALDASRSYRGHQSLKIHLAGVDAGVITTGFVLRMGIPTVGTVAGRAFFYFTGPAPTSGALLAITQPEEPNATLGFVADPSGLASLNSLVGDSLGKVANMAIPTGRWICLETVITLNELAGEAHFFLDDVELTSLARTMEPTQATQVLGNLFVGAFPTLELGTAEQDIWLDEIALDTQRITCAR